MSSITSCIDNLPSEGYFDLSNYGIISVYGEEAKKFLQGQLTCNLEEISPTQSRLGAYCDIKGRVTALFRIVQIEDIYYLILNKHLVEKTLKILERYAVFSRVTLDTTNPFLGHIGFIGKRPDNFPINIDEVATHDGKTIIKIPGIIPRWEILIQTGEPLPQLHPIDSWEAQNILAGIPNLTENTSGEFTAHKLGLISLNAINFKKGCYLGQEIVARTQYLGKQKGGLFWALITSSYHLSPNAEIFDSHKELIGNIISSIVMPNNTTLILAVLKQDPTEEDFISIENNPLKFSIHFTKHEE